MNGYQATFETSAAVLGVAAILAVLAARAAARESTAMPEPAAFGAAGG
ncbi:hypothetical protein QZH47_11615 [Pseudomonas corrugata]